MLPEPLTAARTVFAASGMNSTDPEPGTVTSSRVAAPLPVSVPLPDRLTSNRSALTPLTTTLPLPLSVSPLSDGTVTSTRIGLRVVKEPGVLAMTSVDVRTLVVTRSRRLSSASTTTSCFPPTCTMTSLLPASSTRSNAGRSRACVPGTPDPFVPDGGDPPRCTRRTTAPAPSATARIRASNRRGATVITTLDLPPRRHAHPECLLTGEKGFAADDRPARQPRPPAELPDLDVDRVGIVVRVLLAVFREPRTHVVVVLRAPARSAVDEELVFRHLTPGGDVFGGVAFLECGLRRREARERDSERRARHIVEPEAVAELHRARLAAVLTADPQLELGLRLPSALDADPHQVPDAVLVERLERVALEHPVLEVV